MSSVPGSITVVLGLDLAGQVKATAVRDGRTASGWIKRVVQAELARRANPPSAEQISADYLGQIQAAYLARIDAAAVEAGGLDVLLGLAQARRQAPAKPPVKT